MNQFLLIAHGDANQTAPACLKWCADENEIREAVALAVFGDELLDEAEAMEATGIADELIESGRFDFEGDPPLQLIRVRMD